MIFKPRDIFRHVLAAALRVDPLNAITSPVLKDVRSELRRREAAAD